MNVAAFMEANFAALQLNQTTALKGKSAEKLSSGYRINRASDDAAGLAISEKMRGQIRGLDRGSVNSQDAVSLVQVADGAMQEISDMLNRIRELAVEAANDTNTTEDREEIQLEVDEIKKEIDRIGKTTEFNTLKILQGKYLSDEIDERTLVDFQDTNLYDDQPPQFGMGKSKTLDFSNITLANKRILAGTGFSFLCTQGCDQAFQFTFVDSVPNPTNGNEYGILDKTPNAIIGLGGTNNNKVFEIGLDSFTDGKELVSNVMNFVLEMNGYTPDKNPDSRNYHNVGHDNLMFQDGAKLIVGGNGPHSEGKFKPIELANLMDKVPLRLWVQTNANSGQGMNMSLHRWIRMSWASIIFLLPRITQQSRHWAQ